MKVMNKGVLLSLSLLLVFMLLAAACGNNNNNTAGNNSPKESPAKTPSEQTGDKAAEPVTLDLFVDQTWWPVKDWSGAIPEEISRITGVNLNITVATDEKQLPLMIASGDLPDLVVTSNQYKRMSDPALSYAWGDLIEEHAPDFEIDQARIAVNTASDGEFYTVRNYFSTEAEWKANKETAFLFGGGISVRADILEALGNPEIKSLNDLTNLFQSVQDKYPDMIPLVLNPPHWHRNYFEQQFGVQTGFNDVNGDLSYMLHLPAYKEMYLYMHELYQRGFIKAENYAYKSEDQGKQLMYSGKGFAFSWTTIGSDLLTGAATEQGYKFVNLPVKINDDYKNVNTAAGWQGVFITKNNKNPEASIKLMQFLQSEAGQKLALWGIEGEHWNMAEDANYPVFTYNQLDDALRIEKGAYYWGLLGSSATTELTGNFVPGQDSTETNKQLTGLTTFNPAIGLVAPDADSEEQIILSNIENLVKNEEAKVLLAATTEEASKAYDNMVAQADKMGLKDLEVWANKKYDEVKKYFE
jgi:putative aldouronate transport system substrate-binding protein